MNNDKSRISNRLPRCENESPIEYIYRLCNNRTLYNMTWQEIADTININLGDNKSESYYRKKYAAGAFTPEKAYDDELDCVEEPSEEDTLRDLLTAMRLERVKIRDENTQFNADIRRVARDESIKEIAHDFAMRMNSIKMLPKGMLSFDRMFGDNAAILQISDWHYGIEVDSYFNKYNPEVARQRISNLYEQVIDIAKKEGISNLYVVNLADLICGRIHLTLRLQSRLDVITQIMEVSEILAEFLTDLAGHGFRVHYASCLDNHSRIEPNKKDAIDFESLTRITDWYLRERVGSRVDFIDNKFGPGIITFDVNGYQIAGVHGDRDKPNTVIQHLTLMTKTHYDMVLTAHLHHFSCDEQNETVVVSNGSLMGTDTYAENLRLTSRPSQNLIIVSPKSVCDSIHRLLVD